MLHRPNFESPHRRPRAFAATRPWSSDALPDQILTVDALKISSIEWASDLSNSLSDIW
jgi:hypothetical protein